MPRLSRVQEKTRQEILQLAGRALLPTQLAQRLLSLLQAAIPADGQLLYSLDPAIGLFNRVLASSRLEATASCFLECCPLQAEASCNLAFPTLMRLEDSGLPTQLSFSARAPVLQEGVASRGHRLRLFFWARGHSIAGLEVVRQEARGPFQPSDETFLHLVAPAIGRFLCSALAREHACAEGSAAGTETAGILLLAPDGQITFHTPAAEHWINLLQRGEESLASPVPLVIWSALAWLRRATGGPAQLSVRVPTTKGILRVESSRGSEEDRVAVALVPERGALSSVPPATWPLTQQEKRVLGLLVDGQSTRAMAEALVVSENTLETHLRHIYEKLQVHSRSALLTRLFHEADEPVSSCLC